MQVIKTNTALIALALTLNLSVISAARAGTWYPLPLQTSILNQSSLSGQKATHVVVWSGTNKYVFPLAEDFRLSADSTASRVFLMSRDARRSISIRLMATGIGKPVMDPASLRSGVLSQQAGLKITEESTIYGLGSAGTAFDTQWPIAGGLTQCSRVAYFSTPVGVWEFRAYGAFEFFPQAQGDLGRLLNSFQSNSGSKVEVAAPLDHS